jgi:hypothetical protein
VRLLEKLWIVIVLLVASALCQAAEGEGYKGEVAGFGGLQHFRDSTKATIGGQIGSTFAGNSMVFVETAYVPSYSEGAKLVNFLGGVNIGFPTRLDKLVPYFGVFGGLGRFSGQGVVSESAASFGLSFGARYFLGPRWGVRPEFRWQRYQESGQGLNSYSFSTGLFYRFGER